MSQGDGLCILHKSKRSRSEKAKKEGDIPFPGWDALDAEKDEEAASVVLTIQDDKGNIINKISKRARDGSHRIAWDFSHFNPYPSNSWI